MKKVMIFSGAVSVAAFMFGSFFKVMHWPGAGIMLVCAIMLVSFLFLPLLFILKTRELDSLKNKVILGIGTVLGIMFCMSTLFKVMHWPGANMMWLIGIAIAFLLFLPFYFFSGIRNPETKMNTIVSSVIIVIVVGNLFMLTNLRPNNPTKIFTYLQSEALLAKMHHSVGDTSVLSADNQKLADEINSTCKAIKALVLQDEIGEPVLPKDFDAQKEMIIESSLGDAFMAGDKGQQLILKLKTQVEQYNSAVGNTDSQIAVANSVMDMDFARMDLYTNIFVLNNVTQVQLQLANAVRNTMAGR